MEKHARTRSRPGSITARRSWAQSSSVGQIASYVYVAIVGLGLWYVVSAWAGFVAEDDIAYLLAVVSGLFFIAIAIPCALWLAWRTGRDPHAPRQHVRFRDWASGNFRTWQGDLKASSAAIQILLPIAAVAFGMTAFAVITRAIELGVI